MFRIDQPSKQEKMRMAESIVKAFPVLAGKDGAGYVSIVHFVDCRPDQGSKGVN
jgi:hypothetical protein